MVILDGASAEDGIAALLDVRWVINAPYIDEKMLGFQAKRAERGQIGTLTGEKKKEK